MDYVWIWHLLYFLIAAHFYAFDRKKGTWLRKAYVSYYNLTHSAKNRITDQCNKGFVFNRTTRDKLGISVFFAAFFSLIFFLLGSEIPLPVEGILFFTKTGVVFLGFLAGPSVAMFYSWFQSIITKVDDIETGKLDVKQELSGALGEAGSKVRSAVQVIKEKVETQEPEAKPATEVEVADELKDDAYYADKLRNYTEQ